MSIGRKLGTRELALVICFTALYVVFGAVKISPIIGLPGQAITAAAIIAPVIGIIFGSFIGALSTLLGGIIGFSVGFFPLPSFASGVIAALSSGLASNGKRMVSASVYLSLLAILAFYPIIGSAWLFPLYVWFQVIGFLILISPLESIAIKNLHSDDKSKLFYAFFLISLTATLAGQIAGSITFEAIFTSNLDYWRGTWITTSLLYPIERTIIAIGAGIIGTALLKVLRNTNFTSFLNQPRNSEKHS